MKKIVKYIGLVCREAILGANIFKDIFAGIRDIVGGRSAAYERELRKAKEIAVQEMAEQASSLGGNAVIAVDLDYETSAVPAQICLWLVLAELLLFLKSDLNKFLKYLINNLIFSD